MFRFVVVSVFSGSNRRYKIDDKLLDLLRKIDGELDEDSYLEEVAKRVKNYERNEPLIRSKKPHKIKVPEGKKRKLPAVEFETWLKTHWSDCGFFYHGEFYEDFAPFRVLDDRLKFPLYIQWLHARKAAFGKTKEAEIKPQKQRYDERVLMDFQTVWITKKIVWDFELWESLSREKIFLMFIFTGDRRGERKLIYQKMWRRERARQTAKGTFNDWFQGLKKEIRTKKRERKRS